MKFWFVLCYNHTIITLITVFPTDVILNTTCLYQSHFTAAAAGTTADPLRPRPLEPGPRWEPELFTEKWRPLSCLLPDTMKHIWGLGLYRNHHSVLMAVLRAWQKNEDMQRDGNDISPAIIRGSQEAAEKSFVPGNGCERRPRPSSWKRWSCS